MIHDKLDSIFRIIFTLILFFLPFNWHGVLFSKDTLCYVKGLLPETPAGELDLGSLNGLHWRRIPIQQLWPAIRDNPGISQQLLIDHCHEFSFDQILWIADNDPDNRGILLGNHECMMKVEGLYKMTLGQFRNQFLELPIYSISNLDGFCDDQVILEGLNRINYNFPSRNIKESFLDRFPTKLLKDDSLIFFHRSLNLFDVNFLFLESKKAVWFSLFLFHLKEKGPLWKVSILELRDLVSTFPASIYDSKRILTQCNEIIDNSPDSFSSSLDLLQFRLIKALQTRDSGFFTALGPVAFINSFGKDLGLFDQFRIISSLLPDNFNSFLEYFENNLFDSHALKIYFLANQNNFFKALKEAPLKLLRILALIPSNVMESNYIKLCLVPSPETVNFEDIVHIINSFEWIIDFNHRNFRIKYDDDAVIDLGGPLLDWITRLLDQIIDLGYFSNPVGNEAEARDFLDERIFKFIGFLHGKLIQIGSAPAWVPVIRSSLLDKVAALIQSDVDPSEAVKLFNDFGFPNVSNPAKGVPFRLCCHSEIQLYLNRIEGPFNTWKTRAFDQYYAGLGEFIVNHVPRVFIDKLLRSSEPVSSDELANKSYIQANPDIPYNLSHIWLQILDHLSQKELCKLLLFVTGQYQLTEISVFFVFNDEARLPSSRTCFKILLLYLERPLAPENVLIESLTDSLRKSILEYKGFGNI